MKGLIFQKPLGTIIAELTSTMLRTQTLLLQISSQNISRLSWCFWCELLWLPILLTLPQPLVTGYKKMVQSHVTGTTESPPPGSVLYEAQLTLQNETLLQSLTDFMLSKQKTGKYFIKNTLPHVLRLLYTLITRILYVLVTKQAFYNENQFQCLW